MKALCFRALRALHLRGEGWLLDQFFHGAPRADPSRARNRFTTQTNSLRYILRKVRFSLSSMYKFRLT